MCEAGREGPRNAGSTARAADPASSARLTAPPLQFASPDARGATTRAADSYPAAETVASGSAHALQTPACRGQSEAANPSRALPLPATYEYFITYSRKNRQDPTMDQGRRVAGTVVGRSHLRVNCPRATRQF